MDLRAINHWPKAIETHSANHPEAQHIIEDVNLVDPEAVVENGYLDILMASPECKYYSRARGGKPVHDQGRMMPWAIMNWLTKLDIKAAEPGIRGADRTGSPGTLLPDQDRKPAWTECENVPHFPKCTLFGQKDECWKRFDHEQEPARMENTQKEEPAQKP